MIDLIGAMHQSLYTQPEDEEVNTPFITPSSGTASSRHPSLDPPSCHRRHVAAGLMIVSALIGGMLLWVSLLSNRTERLRQIAPGNTSAAGLMAKMRIHIDTVTP